MFEPISQESFSKREERILNFWTHEKIFERSLEQRKEKSHFTFYDGPPFATGLPHYGHLLAGTIKDVVPRYKTMKGFYVERRFGWDCHGLPIEQEIEKAFNLKGAPAIEEFGIAKFNEECRKIVLRYTEEWKTIVQRMGRWVDFNATWHTMDLSFMESVWWVFKQLFDKGLVYQGFKVMPFSAKLGTPLSNFEASENYKDVDDPALTVAFKLLNEDNTYFLAWTTTPWTLISNLALMVGPEIEYVKVEEKSSKKRYILAKSRLNSTFKDEALYTVVEQYLGKDLEGKSYVPLFNYFKDHKGFKVILEEGVTIDEGTGIVHSAPAFGELDFYACQKNGIELVCPVDNNGLFTDEVPEYKGQFVKDADKDIARRLKAEGHLFKQETINHRYPFCWRSDTPLIYKAVTTWFVAVEKIKDKLLKANSQIHWTPGHLKEGRFGKWLEAAKDWNISRNRYFGTPIPLWQSEDGETVCIGNIEELEKLTHTRISDLHRHFIDDLTFTKDGKVFKRIPEVFDCWFESGSMPYGQNHYPFEHKELFEKSFPADFIAEGIDQTRGWFYTLTVLAAALFDKPAFKNVIVNGILLAADGSKMSKRLKNYPDPMDVVSKHGADAVRLYMMHSPAVKADDLAFKEAGVELVLRQALIPLWNAYSFFLTYANIYGWRPSQELSEGIFKKEPSALIDRWMISITEKLIHEVELGMDQYDLSLAVEPFIGFIDQLTNWYIRRSRRRFWSAVESDDRNEAFATLYHVLLNLSKIAAPFVPFIAEAIFRNLRTKEMKASVHLSDYPHYHAERRDEKLEAGMEMLQNLVSLGHSLRKEQKIRVRQPLKLAEVVCRDPELLKFLEDQKHLIEEELNVKQVTFSSSDEDVVKLVAKANFRVLGKKVGAKMPAVKGRIEKLSHEELTLLLNQKPIEIKIDEEVLTITPEDVQVERVVKEGMVASTSSTLTIVLDTTLTEPLLIEGLAREIVNKVNTMRRDNGFDVSDRVSITINASDRVEKAYKTFADYIDGEVLATSVKFTEALAGDAEEWDLNGEAAKILIEKSS